MSANRDELVLKYIDDLKDKCGIIPDIPLLTKVIVVCGPSIYNKDGSLVAVTQQSELDTVKDSFLIKRLGLSDGPELDKGIEAVIDKYGRTNEYKYRAVVYYLLTRHFNKEKVFSEISV